MNEISDDDKTSTATGPYSISDTKQPDDVVGIPDQRTIRFMRLKSS